MNTSSRICVVGADTLLGAALVRTLTQKGCRSLVADLTGRPEYVFVVAGRSGGILANQKFPADLSLDNLLVATHVLPEAHRIGVKKLLYLGSSCVYPKHAPQPMSPEALLTGPLEPTSGAYAMAKLAGMALCQAYRRQHGAPFIVAIPADAYGPGSKFDPEDSHVVPALLARMHEAKRRGLDHLTLWGSGTPRREFTHADDLASACLVVMRDYDGEEPINLGSGETATIRELAEKVREVVGFEGELRWNPTRPDGAPAKWLDTVPLRTLGWKPSVSLEKGLRATYDALLRLEPSRQRPAP